MLEEEGVGFQQVTDVFMQFCINEVDEQRIREEDSQQVIRVVGVEVRVAGECIRTSQEVAWEMDDLQVEVCKIKQPPGLVAVKVLGLMEVRQVLVVHKDLDREWGSMEVMSPGFQGVDDGEEFAVVDVVVSFSGDERLQEV